MRSQSCQSGEYFASVCLYFVSALALLAFVLFVPDVALAQKPASVDPGPSQVPGIMVTPSTPLPDTDDSTRKLPDLRAWLSYEDGLAMLEHVRIALAEVGDGSTYVWHRHHGRLSGTVKPTQSFVSGAGRLCRHIVMTMASGGYSNQTEGVACRLETGRWQLEG
ncbi:MAG: hypothetical protein RL291_190 [Pseudomonadota bacterium]|jgi:hypothetical protein